MEVAGTININKNHATPSSPQELLHRYPHLPDTKQSQRSNNRVPWGWGGYTGTSEARDVGRPENFLDKAGVTCVQPRPWCLHRGPQGMHPLLGTQMRSQGLP